MSRLPASATVRPFAGHSAYQVLIVFTAGLSLGVAAFVTESYVTNSRQQQTPPASERASLPASVAKSGQGDSEVYTGSILYMPEDGKQCRQLLFDNLTGAFTDNGYVSCEKVASNGIDGPKHWSAARIQVIATGFRSGTD